MDLTPQTLDEAEFREAKRGYNTQDVDEFLERVREGVVRKEAQLREAVGRIEVAETRAVEAERQAASSSGPSEADETLKRTLVLAQRTADAAIKEADEQAARTIAAAQDQSTRLLAEAQETSARARAEADAEARRAHEEARARVLAELQELEAARDQLHGDVDMLERHLSEQRDRLRDASRELQRLLDDPGALREVAVPVIAPISVPTTVLASSAPAPYAASPVASAAAPEPPIPAEPEGGDDPVAWVPDDEEWDEPAAELPPVADDPATEAIDMLEERDAGDDEYLAELRKAMTDEAPLGPRDEDEDPDLDVPRTRFGRRR